MKRAEVWRASDGEWSCEVYDDLWNPGRKRTESSLRVAARDPATVATDTDHPTHAEALAHALHEVGLTPTNPEKEQA